MRSPEPRNRRLTSGRRLHGRPWPIHILLLPAVPVLALWAENAKLIRSLYPLRISLGVLGAAVVLALIVSVVQRDVRRSAITATVAVSTAVSIGHVFPDPRRAAVTVTVLVVVMLSATLLASRLNEGAVRGLTILLNVIAATLVIYNVGVIVLNRPPLSRPL